MLLKAHKTYFNHALAASRVKNVQLHTKQQKCCESAKNKVTMYHESTRWDEKPYYDTIKEMPTKATVRFPDGTKKQMSADEIVALDDDGWLTVMHSCNYGVCDHWISEKPSKWVQERFNRIIAYKDKSNKIVGFNRISWTIVLTKEKVWHSEVWNS